ncbi:MAG TPA: hypothetical protein DD649_17375 [Providencia sp.]|nr:hypothetical protein [Providencia sp.]
MIGLADRGGLGGGVYNDIVSIEIILFSYKFTMKLDLNLLEYKILTLNFLIILKLIYWVMIILVYIYMNYNLLRFLLSGVNLKIRK